MIRRLLIANRGEIAVRVARAARAMGIVPLGIYSDADARAYHLSFMDDARRIGPAPAAESYLDARAILAAAREMNAEALHPGYGFLSENPAFAQDVHDAGLIFVGPPPPALAAAGSKIEAKRRARAVGVPTVPGYDGEDQSDARLRAEAERIGFPVLVKASAGGGGRGMRVVLAAPELEEAIAAAKREALGAFGDATLLLERYLQNPRHIEFQILADAFGTTRHLGERECSIQRRHQKIVEEAPSVALTPELRTRMGVSAVSIATSIGYVNAGTVEFMLDRDAYYFLEMNARLQVEHPVTEMVYGIDLVQWQLRIAAGERLELPLDLTPSGWAIETRITAEDPAHAMLPSSGTIASWREPHGPGVRVDAGVTGGSRVGLDYDSMLAKLIVHAPDRAAAITRLEHALDDFEVEGVRTNLPLLEWIARDEAFRSGELGTSFLAQRLDESRFVPVPASREAVLLAVARILAERAPPWRIGGVGAPLFLETGERRIELWASTTAVAGAWRLSGDLEGELRSNREGTRIVARLGDERVRGRVFAEGGALLVHTGERTYALRFAEPPSMSAHVAASGQANGRVESPMPGRVVRVAVTPGQEVEPHQLLVVLEAMKMEHRIEASLAAHVRAVLVREGEIVAGGAPLVELR